MFKSASYLYFHVMTYSGPCLTANEDVVSEKTEQEGNVCLSAVSDAFPHEDYGAITLTPRIRNSTKARNIFLRATS